MAERTVEAEPAQKEEQGSSSRVTEFALLFELETLAVAGRQATFELLRSLLDEQGVKLTPPAFSRFCLYDRPRVYVPELLESLGGKKGAADKLLEDLESGYAMFLSSKDSSLDGALEELITRAVERSVSVAALSALSEEDSVNLMAKLGLTEMGVELFRVNGGSDDICPHADTWMKIAKAMSKSPRRCVVLASSAVSCKAALSAGMRCVALPDMFTAFEDFGGAEIVLDSLADQDMDELLDLIFPAID